jgi:hypothetical protein
VPTIDAELAVRLAKQRLQVQLSLGLLKESIERGTVTGGMLGGTESCVVFIWSRMSRLICIMALMWLRGS